MFVPLHDLLVVRRAETMTITPGGVTIPDRAQESSREGEVVAVSEGCYDANGNFRKLRVEVGDHILFQRDAGLPVKLEGEDLVLMLEREILGVFLPKSANAKAA